MLHIFKKVIKSGLQSFERNRWLGIATILTMVLTICMITSLLLLKGVTNFLVTSLQDKVDISVYFKPDATEMQILGVKDNLQQIPEQGKG